MAQEHLRISSDWGSITAELADNDAARAVIKMLPIAIDMRDHLRQEKTGNLPIAVAGDSPATRFCSRHAWALGARSLCYLLHQGPWNQQPGIAILGTVTGDITIFDRPGPISVRVEAVHP